MRLLPRLPFRLLNILNLFRLPHELLPEPRTLKHDLYLTRKLLIVVPLSKPLDVLYRVPPTIPHHPEVILELLSDVILVSLIILPFRDPSNYNVPFDCFEGRLTGHYLCVGTIVALYWISSVLLKLPLHSLNSVLKSLYHNLILILILNQLFDHRLVVSRAVPEILSLRVFESLHEIIELLSCC